MKSVVFLLLLAVAVSRAQKKCCVPNQYEIMARQVVSFIDLSGKPRLWIESIQMAFDHTNKRESQLFTIKDKGDISKLRVVLNYNTHSEYSIQEDTKTCQKVQFSGSDMRCVPDEATFVNSFYVADRKVTVDSFDYYQDEGHVYGNVTFSVSRGECIPVSSTFIGVKNEVPEAIFTEYFNYTYGIKDPSRYFNIPSYCPKSFTKDPSHSALKILSL